MAENLRLAAEEAVNLAVLPAQGPTYKKFRDQMLAIEATCRQAAVWRSDSRWFDVGMTIALSLQMTGKWLRGYKVKGRMGKTLYPRDLYLELAKQLRNIAIVMDGIRHQATGQMGMILPPVAPLFRDNRPVQVKTPGGIILPE